MPTLGVLVMLFGLAQASPQDALARARELYNAQHYDAAIAAADEARRIPRFASQAAIVAARAHLERYRAGTQDAEDLAAARTDLKSVDAAALPPAAYDEFLIGLGESLYCDERFGAAAELFELALYRDTDTDEAAREKKFEWWAGALDEEAQLGPDADRKALYGRILAGATDELHRHERSATASYWLVASTLGVDDLDRAWSAAIATWVRAPSTTSHGVMLRADLDRLVTLTILPERARRLSGSADSQAMVERLSREWQSVKDLWR